MNSEIEASSGLLLAHQDKLVARLISLQTALLLLIPCYILADVLSDGSLMRP